VNRRRCVAALAVAIGTTIAALGCALPTRSGDAVSVDDVSVDDTDSYRSEQWSDLPTRHAVPPIPVSVVPSAGQLPPIPGGWTRAVAPSGPLPSDMTDRVAAARAAAAARGADVAVSLLDRSTGDHVVADGSTAVETASVAKLFIADAVLHENPTPSADDLELIARMLERSDDAAANALWFAYGGDAIVDAVVARYGLHATTAPWDGNWWNTMTTPDDLVEYYAGLLDGTGGLSNEASETVLSHLRAATPTAADGYDQRFGIPDALVYESGNVAVKQGWMCCTAGRWVHLSTAVIGPQSRYVLVVVSHEDVDYGTGSDGLNQVVAALPDTSLDAAVEDASAAHARETITDVVRILFPEGRIG
jgi:hypothetical protein